MVEYRVRHIAVEDKENKELVGVITQLGIVSQKTHTQKLRSDAYAI